MSTPRGAAVAAAAGGAVMALILLIIVLAVTLTPGQVGKDSSSNLRSNEDYRNANISVPLLDTTASTKSIQLKNEHKQLQKRQGMDIVYACPEKGPWPEIVVTNETTYLLLQRAEDHVMCGLAIVVEQGGDRALIQLARSYSSNDWEITAGKFASQLPPPDCSIAGINYCRVDLGRNGQLLPELQGATLVLPYSHRIEYSTRDQIARFLEQTTFGVTMEEIKEIEGWMTADGAAMTSQSMQHYFAKWIQNQQDNVPILSHRALFRRHANDRLESPSAIAAAHPPCLAGARYRREAFSTLDAAKLLEVRRIGNSTRMALLVEGQLRTVIEPPIYTQTFGWNGRVIELEWEDGFYTICKQELRTFGEFVVKVAHPNHKWCKPFLTKAEGGQRYYANPPVSWTQQDLIDLGLDLRSVAIPDEAARTIDDQWFAFTNEHSQRFTTPSNPEIILQQDLLAASDPIVCDNQDDLPWIATWKNEQYLYDPRPRLQDNDMMDPLEDGGGGAMQEHTDLMSSGVAPLCSNVPRDFVNEDFCRISTSPDVCAYRWFQNEDSNTNNAIDRKVFFQVTPENLRAINEATQADDSVHDVYLYAIDGLDINKDEAAPRPCTPGTKSSWISIACSATTISRVGSDNMHPSTGEFFLDNIQSAQGSNTFVVEIQHEANSESHCHPDDVDRVDLLLRDPDTDRCWTSVHPDHLSVYDFANWVDSHPGGASAILAPAQAGNVTLTFPSWHELSRWEGNKAKLQTARMKLGDTKNFYKLPIPLRTQAVANALGIGDVVAAANAESLQTMLTSTSTQQSKNILVCGSPNEVANDPFLGGSWERGGFTLQGFNLAGPLARGVQREQVWFEAILSDPGQLRQRAAWALSQILVVTAAVSQSKGRAEAHIKYYDIFVRHAFGNYRDILKEVSYSPIMGQMLSYVAGKSTAFTRAQSGVVLYADENYAREIMQLFTTGLIKLNRDGTEKYDANNKTSLVYTNDDVEEYARAWTGFAKQRQRANMEGADTPGNFIDPMRVMSLWRDPFPKMGLGENYVGDGKPLCSDLPLKHFLAKGATYVLLGGTPVPESQEDPTGWNAYNTMPGDSQLSLDSASPLYQRLCSPNASGQCVFMNKVVLDHPIDCYGQECLIDTVRSLEVARMFYEYVRPPCVHPLFYENAKTVVRRWGPTQAMCADPHTESASVACCKETNMSSSVWAEQYFGERTLLSTADARCNQILCNPEQRPLCHGTASLRCRDNTYVWTAQSCELKAKIDRVTGKVGIVHQPKDVTDSDVASLVQSSQPTYFRVEYDGGYYGQLKGCEDWAFCSVTEDDKCLCSVTVSQIQVFDGFTTPSKQEILSSLHVGAFETNETAHFSNDDVKVYRKDPSGALSKDTVFDVVDEYGIRQLRKNVKLLVQVRGTNTTFRNPIHFLSLADPEVRDAEYETEATLDHYFFHENTAPFLAIRFAQRFGISNPSPRYINAIASAFVSGSYTSDSAAGEEETRFGSGKYGDLAATFAAVLLDREARSIILDTDPNYGSLKEPLMKLVSLMRTFKFQPNRNPFTWADFDFGAGDKLGQWPHRIPSVFSFFLPEYSPKGRVGMGSLVSPESQVMTGPRIIDTMNGIFSLLKQGLTFCNDGFGPDLIDTCGGVDYGDTSKGVGHLTFEPESSADDIVDELATLMTAGRLNEATRQLIKRIYSNSDPLTGMIKAQMMIATTPEFHSIGTVRPKTVSRRSRPTPQASEKSYKSLVYIFLKGGMDSYNMLAPHNCQGVNSNGHTLREQYDVERTTIGLADDERSRIIDASDQPCSQFAIHPQLSFVERLYNSGELSFFANVGHMEAPVTKDNYNAVTKAQLFAHNVMQDACYKTDPNDSNPGTGILGRMSDKLLEKGFKPQPLTIDEETSATVGASIPPLVGATLGVKKFAVPSRGEGFDMNDHVFILNNATELRGNVFGETWSSKLRAAIDDADMMADGIDKIVLEEVYPAEIVGDTVYPRTAEALSSIVLTHQHRGSDRDVIFVPLGSWDHHASVKSSSDGEFQRLDKFLTLFEKEMKAKGLWEQVTVAVGSDFGRTLTPNSNEGSDHAWGGHYFMFGGSIKGGKIHGDYPSDITENGPLNIGRGRLLPTLSWESVLSSAAEWMGLETDEELDYVFPNRAGQGAKIFPMSEVFD